MKSLIRCAPMLFVVALTESIPASTHQGSISVDVGRGPITVHIPAGYDPMNPAPLVMVLHCYGCSPSFMDSYFQLGTLMDQYGFLYVTPQGLSHCNINYWNATDACCDFAPSGVDDSTYLRDLIDEIKVQLSVDPRRVYSFGWSNGGFMSYRMACDHADQIAAIASLAGATWFDTTDCAPSEPVHVLQIHGTNDGIVLYPGSTTAINVTCTGGDVPYPGAVGSAERWAIYNGGQPGGQTLPTQLDVACIAGDETTVMRWDGCDVGGSAELWTINGGPHLPCLQPQFPNMVIDYFFAHPKPGVDPIPYCSPAVPNSSGVPAQITATGSDAVVDNSLTLVATDMPPGEFGYFLTSVTQANTFPVPNSQGALCVGGAIGRYNANVFNTGAGGTASLQIDLENTPTPSGPVAILGGDTWHFTAWFRDLNPIQTSTSRTVSP